MNENILWLHELRLADLARVGGKNSSLGEMIGNLAGLGVSVPGGYATTAEAFKDFIAHNDLSKRIFDKLATLDKAFHFTGTPNGEIAMRWYPLASRSGYEQANEGAVAFIERVGRRKLILPIYAELVKTPEGLAFAKQTFAKAKPGYHPITAGSVESTLAEAKPAVASAPATEAPAAEQPTAPAQAGGRHGDPTAETPATAPTEPEKPAETR